MAKPSETHGNVYDSPLIHHIYPNLLRVSVMMSNYLHSDHRFPGSVGQYNLLFLDSSLAQVITAWWLWELFYPTDNQRMGSLIIHQGQGGDI